MPIINITVAGKIATNTTPGEVIVCGNSDYSVNFAFDSEWAAEAIRTARFVYYKDGLSLYQEVVFTGDTVAVPVLSGISYVLVGVYAGNLHTTTPAKVLCDRSILCGSGIHEEPPEDVYQQLLALISSGAIKGPPGDPATDEQVEAAVSEWMEEHPDAVSVPQSAVDAWLDAHPEATTTVQDGSITEEKLAEDVKNKIVAAGEGGYKWAARGYMREHVRDFQGWAHCVRYDPKLGKAVGLVISGTGSHSNTVPYYRVEIDPATGYMSDYVEVVVNYPDGAEYTECGYIGSFVIKPDGTYWMCDYYKKIFTSNDKGYTWDYVGNITLGRSTFNNDFLFGAIRLSNGYMVAGNGGNPAAETYYSTDDGVTWNVVTMNRSGLGQQVYPEGGYTPFEPFFVECGDGKVIQYARASMNAYKTYAEGSCTAKEAACYSISEDYGVTWSAWQWSTALADMTANNGRAVVIGDKVHAVYGSRYHAEDNYFHLFYSTTTLTDILEDKWETPVVIEVGHWDVETATNPHDCGYPSIFADANNNLFAVYYDSDGTGTAYGANWRLCIGTQAAAQVAPVTSEGKGSTVVGYTQSAVDKLIQSLLNKINDLYLKIGELPEQGELDGSMPVLDGLVEWFEPGDSTQWSDTVVNSKINSGHTADGLNNGASGIYAASIVAPTEFAGNMCKGGILFDATITEYGITDSFTMEFVMDMYDNNSHYLLLQSPINMTGNNTTIYFRNNNFGTYDKTACHIVVTFTPEEKIIYYNGNKYETSTALTEDQFAAAHPICRAFNGAIGGVRLYNRALTADEIQNNYKYASTLTTFGTDYFT